MKLSIIIVNYNVKYFLEQCLSSVKISSKKIKTEVFVIDNNSIDGSSKMVQEKYGWKQADEPFERTYRRVSNLDDRYENGIHDLMKILHIYFS